MEIISINVTQLKCACLNPEWKKKWINGENPSTLISTNYKGQAAYGSVFHKIVEDFVNWLITQDYRKTDFSDPIIIWQNMYDFFAKEHLEKILLHGNMDSANHLVKSLKAFCKNLIELRKKARNFKSWQDIFLANEYDILDVQFKVGKKSVYVSGRLDAIRSHPEHGLEIVDYKLSHGVNLKHDLIQIAIYAKILSMTKPGLEFTSVLEYYEPELYKTNVSEKELNNIFDDLVSPVIYELAGQANPPESINNNNDLSEKIVSCFRNFNLNINVIERLNAPQIVRYRVKPDSGVKVVSLANRAQDLQVALSLSNTPQIEPDRGCVSIDIPKEKLDVVYWNNIIKHSIYLNNKSRVSFPVGIGIDNKPVIADFSDPNMCHALVAGSSGSGKSEFLKTLVASLMAKNSPEQLKLSIIDPKILTFGSINNCPYLTQPVITDIECALPFLEGAVNEMNTRYEKLQDEGYENIYQSIQNKRPNIASMVIVFDEFADLILAGKTEKKEFERLVSRIAAKGRAAGIHLVLTTQRPENKIVTGLIKANLPLKICLKVTTVRNSLLILDQSAGENLLGKGDLLCEMGASIIRAQSPYIAKDDLLLIAKGN